MLKLSYAIVFAIVASAALFTLPGLDDAQNAVTKSQESRCAAFAAAGIEC